MGAWLIVPLLATPLVDQGVKQVLRRWLGARSVRMGPLVSLRMASARVWLTRLDRPSGVLPMWIVWLAAAAALAMLSRVIPASGLFVGLLLGGSLSHALEMSWRGSVSDYICSRWWPAFNLADVAITAGALGFLTQAAFAFERVFA